jgi:hypothetical protein
MRVATYGAETVQTATEEHLRSDYVDRSAVGDVHLRKRDAGRAARHVGQRTRRLGTPLHNGARVTVGPPDTVLTAQLVADVYGVTAAVQPHPTR